MPKVLIGITTRNRADILPKALASAAHQDYPEKRTVVLDDASTDGTTGLASSYPKVEWVRRDSPRGYRENRNQMMQYPGIDYYVSLDDDAWFIQDDEIRIAVDLLEKDPSVGAVAFDILSPDRRKTVERTAPVDTSLFIGCGHVVRVQAVRKAGWYEDVPGAYGGEEKDLCLRLMNLDYRVVKLPGVHVWHDKAWSGRDWYPLHRSGVCNDLVMAARRYPFPDVLGAVPYKIMSHLRFALKKPELMRAALSGIGMFFWHLPATTRSRRPVNRAVFRKTFRR
jgi:GT2 family glycosyltransferase